MKIKDIIIAAAAEAGRTDVAEFLTAGIGSDVAALERETEALVRCYNLVEAELALEYLPLYVRERVAVTDGAVRYSDLAKRVIEIKQVTRGGASVRWSVGTECVFTENGEVEIVYSYMPVKKSLLDDCSYGAREERALVLGVVSEYQLVCGQYDSAVVWDRRYKDTLAALCRSRGGRLKMRRWV